MASATEWGLNGQSTVKILIVSGIFPPDIGGPATYVPEVARELVGRGHEVTVLTTSEPEHLQVRLVTAPGGRNSGFLLLGWLLSRLGAGTVGAIETAGQVGKIEGAGEMRWNADFGGSCVQPGYRRFRH